jgi:hypothetical protein
VFAVALVGACCSCLFEAAGVGHTHGGQQAELMMLSTA